ncbi:S-adenosyl-L-methionine-dependent methyltransferase [Entophlyctis helioformis]|nr:S-adenosyl-L-methionine-dependent methyltransferase [Entophlyctis helioformis]
MSETQVPAAVEPAPSKLGTKDYWDKVYEVEVDNFDDHGDKGEVWFGETSVDKMIEWVRKNWADKADPIIDLGCGNGHLLFELRDLGYSDLVGVDYSAKAIELAVKIAADTAAATGAESELESESETADSDSESGSKHQRSDVPIAFEVLDILSVDDIEGRQSVAGRRRANHAGVYGLALDKGTYDAISLTATDESARHPTAVYVDTVALMLRAGGVLLITSCNWTEPELVARFESRFEFAGRVKYPVFKFGGVVGQTITTIALKRRSDV